MRRASPVLSRHIRHCIESTQNSTLAYHTRLHVQPLRLKPTATMWGRHGRWPSASPRSTNGEHHGDQRCLGSRGKKYVCDRSWRLPCCARYSLRMGDAHPRLPLRRMRGCGDVRARRSADADVRRPRLVDRRTVRPARPPHDALRPGRAVRGRADPPLWSTQGASLVSGLADHWPARRHHHDGEMAALGLSGHRPGSSTRHDGTRHGDDDRHTVVHRSTWPRAGDPGRRKCDRAVDLPDAGSLDRAHLWLAHGAGAADAYDHGPGAAGRAARGRSAGGYGARTLWRGHRAADAPAQGKCVCDQR